MGRDKRPGKVEAHIRITLNLLDSPAFLALDWTARALFLDLRARMRSTNNGDINAAFAELRHRGWTSPTTLAKSLRQLEAVGLISKTRQTIGVERGSKVCNLYRFTDTEVYARPKLEIEAMQATHDYKTFTTLTDARRAVVAASPPTPKKNRTLQILDRDDTDSVATGAINATDSVVRPHAPTTKNVASKTYKTQFEANIHAGLSAI